MINSSVRWQKQTKTQQQWPSKGKEGKVKGKDKRKSKSSEGFLEAAFLGRH